MRKQKTLGNSLRSYFSKPANVITIIFLIVLLLTVVLPLSTLLIGSFKVNGNQEAIWIDQDGVEDGSWTLNYTGALRSGAAAQCCFIQKAKSTSGYAVSLSYNSIISNSNRPLHLAVTVGLVMSVLSFLMAIYNIIAKFSGLNEVEGYTSTIFSIWFVGGILLFMMGILGLYIGKIFDQVKGRPVFIVSETLNIER